MAQQPDESTSANSATSLDERTIRLTEEPVQENVLSLVYGAEFLDELNGVARSKRMFDAVIVDCTLCGFFFPAEIVTQAAEIARQMLEVQGALTFVKADRAMAIIKVSALGDLSFQIFESIAQIYDYSPSLAQHIQTALGTSPQIGEGENDLSEQVLLAAMPVLTSFGIKLKSGMESSRRRNFVLAAIDNYTPLSSIFQRLSGRFSMDEVLEELRALEESGGIYPIFPKIPFLVQSFRNHVPFKLQDYLVEARLITRNQLDDVLFTMQNSKGAERMSIGALCVSRGLISSRQLEIALQDQAFYGQSGDSEKLKIFVEPGEESRVQSLVGHLGTTDPAGVLQNLASNRETGVLSVEHRDLQFRALLENGKLTHARQGKLKGNQAVIEFVSVWKDGIFVFIERQPPPDLTDEACRLSKPLDKLLLDSALASDNIEMIWKKLPKGVETTLEKVEDSGRLFEAEGLVDPQDQSRLTEEDVQLMQRLWREFDGLLPLSTVIKRLGDVATIQVAFAVNRLLHYQLCKVPQVDLNAPLRRFQAIAAAIASTLGGDRNDALLRLSLQASAGYSVRARMFSIGTAGEVGVDLAAARQAGTSLTTVIKQLEDWQVKYIEYVSQELDKNILRDIVYRVHRQV